jgi:UDP-N-acetylglucosamine--N-acetylmuramyl-(pentapeptide) pyrophosphoryl-undecaprenol N-acetylglucosamine transferase
LNSKKRTKIIFTGGGTAGHVTPNMALIETFLQQGYDPVYIGSYSGIEKTMIQNMGIPYYPIDSGKLRRHWSFKHFTEPFHILRGILQAFLLLGRLKPNVVFSKGGFVSFPVVFSAWLRGIPVIVHESDMSPGLANRLAFPFAHKICVNFPQTLKYFKDRTQVHVTGTPIRQSLLQGNRDKGFAWTNLKDNKPVVMLIGGSLGSQKLNKVFREILPQILNQYHVIHICGKNNLDPSLQKLEGYCQFEFVNQELGDLFAISDMVISRSGANALYELLSLGKPHLLVPLSKQASRGDQIENANYFANLGVSHVLDDEQVTSKNMLQGIETVMSQKEDLRTKIQGLGLTSSTEKVKAVIDEYLEGVDAQKKWVTD